MSAGNRQGPEAEAFFDLSLDMLSVADLEGRLLRVNPTWETVLGYRASNLLGTTYLSLVHPDDVRTAREAMAHLATIGVVVSFVHRCRAKNGVYRWVELDARRDGELVYSTVRDITTRQTLASDKRRLEAALAQTEERHQKLFESMLEGFAYCRMIFDEDGAPIDWVYLEVNAAFERLTGLQDVVGKRVLEILPTIKDDTPELFEAYGQVSTTRQPRRLELNFKTLSMWLDIAVLSPEMGHFVAFFEDITNRKIAEGSRLRELEELAQTDTLTGLYNRRGFDMLAAHAVAQASRANQDIGIIYADMDGLKRINDTLGHSAGDQALRDASSILKFTLRSADLIARVGGDEFVALAVGDDAHSINVLGERVQQGVEFFNSTNDREYELSISCGTSSSHNRPNIGLEQLIAAADVAMYQAKLHKVGR